MYTKSTEYRLACTPADYRALHVFMKSEVTHQIAIKEQIPAPTAVKLQFPTVYALRSNKVVGIMASQMNKRWGLVASPLHVTYDIKNHVPMVFRLIDCYEELLRDAGLTEYKVVSPAYKPSGTRIWEELRNATLVQQSDNGRFNLYRVSLG